MTADDDLDRLIEALDGGHLAHPRSSAPLDRWLTRMAERGASDLVLLAGEPPAFRIHGAIERSDAPALDGDDVEALVLPVLSPQAAHGYRERGTIDVSHRLAAVGRFRVNLHRERGRAGAVIRMLPGRVPRLAALGLPPATESLARIAHGLVIVGGATGSGKTTTVAALVEEINHGATRHIITIEDPIEYEHTNRRSLIQQVEIGVDAPDFPTALRSALRQAPDVIVIGEMRDPETMHIALAAGETGHLVLTTLHTNDVPSTIARVTDSFPAERQPTIRQEIAAALSAVYVQTLLPRREGGRVAAAELLIVGYGARQHIRKNALHHLHQEITITRRQGSFTLEESLASLVNAGAVDRAEAALRANHPDDFAGGIR